MSLRSRTRRSGRRTEARVPPRSPVSQGSHPSRRRRAEARPRARRRPPRLPRMAHVRVGPNECRGGDRAGERDPGGDGARPTGRGRKPQLWFGRRLVRHDRAHEGDPDRSADLARGVHDRRADAGLVDWDAAEGGGARRRHHGCHADAAENHAGQETQVPLVDAESREGEELHATSVIPTVSSQREPTGRRGGRRAGRRRRSTASAAGTRRPPGRRVPQDVLHVQRDEEEDAEHRERHHQDVMFAPVNVRLRKSERSSIGARCRDSSRTNTASATAASANAPRIGADVHPSDPPRSARRSGRRARCPTMTSPAGLVADHPTCPSTRRSAGSSRRSRSRRWER